MTSAVPITGRPSACRPNTASEKRSCTSSCGVSSYMAISSSTTSRSESRSENAGAKTMSVMTSSAVCTCASGTRAYTIVCSREVAAFSSPPSPSKISAICCAVYACEPLNRRCSMKCETPAFASVSSREPAPIQNPIATERTPGTRSEITRSPESSSERTYFCTPALSQDGHQLPVCLQQSVHELVDLPKGELAGRVWVEHGCVVDVVTAARQRGLDGQLLDVEVRP